MSMSTAYRFVFVCVFTLRLRSVLHPPLCHYVIEQVWDTARPKAPPSQFEMPGKAVAISSGGIHVAGWKPGGRKVIITHVADAAASAEVEWSGARLSAFKFSSNGSHAILAGDQPHLEVYKLGSRKPIPSDRPEAIAGDSVEAFTDCDSYETADGVFAIGAITTNGLVYVWESTRGALSLSFSSHYPGHIPRKVSRTNPESRRLYVIISAPASAAATPPLLSLMYISKTRVLHMCVRMRMHVSLLYL